MLEEKTWNSKTHTQACTIVHTRPTTLYTTGLTLTAEQANLQVTEDSSLRAFWSKGTRSTRDRGLPEQDSEAIRQLYLYMGSGRGRRHDRGGECPTRCALHTGQPAVHVVARLDERRLQDCAAEDRRGAPDLGVRVVDEAQHVADILLLCIGGVGGRGGSDRQTQHW